MSTTAQIQHKGQVTIPTHLRQQAGLSIGELVEFSSRRGRLIITPKLVVDRSHFPNADHEYTPEQRRAIDAQLDEAEKSLSHGPFTADQAIVLSVKN